MTTANTTHTQNGAIAPEKPMIFTISGDLGSGKSLLTAALVERWGAERYSTGLVQRQLAEQMGITTLELNRLAETDKSIDDKIDSVFKSLSETTRNLVVDSRMAFHFLPMSFRIKLEVYPKVAAVRIKGDTSRIGEGNYETLDEIEAAIVARKSSERERFKRYYNADIEDHAGFTLVINTTKVPAADVNNKVNECVDLWRQGKLDEKLWVSPQHLFIPFPPEKVDSVKVEGCRASWPQPGAWPKAAVKVARVGHRYIVTEGAEWVVAGIVGQCVLMPVHLTGQIVDVPSDEITKKWENLYNYNHL